MAYASFSFLPCSSLLEVSLLPPQDAGRSPPSMLSPPLPQAARLYSSARKKNGKGIEEDNAEAQEQERLAILKARNSDDFERFGSFTFSNLKEDFGGRASQRQNKRKKQTNIDILVLSRGA
ncbi:hypothetical protein CFC21_083424 [Triticum aestivum]|uniref:Uncharacterized protein n=2 Tax=Triticum aestivum TaxID=4565 RepID=A0A9R1I8X9_WHEAT|nr:uncharacterized protein LOC123127374 isoform X1 [Triticum aestivum]KAF7079138.1 hypothetical protein CFC21_083424 [Triticum aestivum]